MFTLYHKVIVEKDLINVLKKRGMKSPNQGKEIIAPNGVDKENSNISFTKEKKDIWKRTTLKTTRIGSKRKVIPLLMYVTKLIWMTCLLILGG